MTVPLSILDLAIIDEGESARDSFASSLALAREAEKLGYTRIWYAEHHNMPTIASSATSVLIGYIAAHTESIRLGAGGVMLPNHAPLTIAEQFGTLETLFPGRIDLGLGRAPGSDQKTMRALRRDPMSADSFPQDVQELQGYLTGNTLIPGISATPGAGTNVPLYILGSSLFGAKLAAALGLPYSFASHFAPQALQDAVSIYRRDFKPSAQLAEPYVIAGVNVIAADTTEEAQELFADSMRRRVTQLFGRDRTFTDEEADAILQSPGGQQVKQMGRYSAVGNPGEVRDYLDWFTGHAQADELIVATQTATLETRLRSFELLAEAALPVGA
ncbi:LLM class flavin-dependent oxidoreductase [Arthrobacter zhangbolii]|uniref:LLM class flavin-dependent oxidoreductase n=1 Tax=Arthrobacter zhangbolii TaxID=2886936 RepID=A0A9X1MA33_9MICC|nr:LLM class flavin-dependent oxidoreductase [Arthrobacter zhangbolii]MCC3274071.1 LLM class flavin-dependent oxidoreductase [Arthrobacter zhangbolii]MCC3295131.1 LLM class flavin-dependent oxidoreductase [Arthrobacter zhangbolii]UON92865.1 LLM class flavin-dependent oxidoreductase [Arthrobacter zhangbolii]